MFHYFESSSYILSFEDLYIPIADAQTYAEQGFMFIFFQRLN